MKLRNKILLLIFSLVLATSGFLFLQSSGVLKTDKSLFVTQSNADRSIALGNLLLQTMKRYEAKLVSFVLNFENIKNILGEEKSLSFLLGQVPEFAGIVQLQVDAQNGQLQILKKIPNNFNKNSADLTDQALQKWLSSWASSQKGKNRHPLQIGFWPTKNKNLLWFSSKLKLQNQSLVILALLNSQSLYDNFSNLKSELNTSYFTFADGTIFLHPEIKKIGTKSTELMLVQAAFKELNQGGAKTYELEEEEWIGGYFAPKYLSAAAFTITSKQKAMSAFQTLQRQLLLASLIILIVATFLGFILAQAITKPVQKLTDLTAEIAQGNFQVQIEIKGKDEIAQLAGAFQTMTSGLISRDEALELANSALVKSEKMAAFGQLGAGIAHEIKNPLSGIIGNSQMAKEKIPETIEKASTIKTYLDTIIKEAKRCKEIAESLMKFATQTDPKAEPCNIQEVIVGGIGLMDHQLSLSGIHIHRDIDRNLPKCLVNTQQIQQVMMSIMLNSEWAMPKGGNLTVGAYASQNEGYALITIADEGCGMDETTLSRCFEPFYTTKNLGQGSGLGLSVAQGIIRDHKGAISVDSQLNVGTTFYIELPFAVTQQNELIAADEEVVSKLLLTDEDVARVAAEAKERNKQKKAQAAATQLSAKPEPSAAKIPPPPKLPAPPKEITIIKEVETVTEPVEKIAQMPASELEPTPPPKPEIEIQSHSIAELPQAAQPVLPESPMTAPPLMNADIAIRRPLLLEEYTHKKQTISFKNVAIEVRRPFLKMAKG